MSRIGQCRTWIMIQKAILAFVADSSSTKRCCCIANLVDAVASLHPQQANTSSGQSSPLPWQASLSPRSARRSLARPARLFQSSPSPLNPYVTFNGQKSFALRTIENRERDRFDEINRQYFLPNNTHPAKKKRKSLEKKPIRLKFDYFTGIGRSNFKIAPINAPL